MSNYKLYELDIFELSKNFSLVLTALDPNDAQVFISNAKDTLEDFSRELYIQNELRLFRLELEAEKKGLTLLA